MIWLLLAAADMQVRIDTKYLPTLRIELTLAEQPTRLCTDIVGGGRGIRGLKPLPDDPDCFEPASAYHVDLKALDSDNPDFAAEVGGAWIWNDQAVLLRPEPLPDHFRVEVTVNAPTMTVWPKLGNAFVADAAALDGGSYWGLGKWAVLPPLQISGREVGFVKVAQATKVDDATLRAWVERSLMAVSSFHGMLPAERMLVLLAPVRFSSTGGVFGSILRRHWATAMLLFGARAAPEEFEGDWMAVHELFHSVMPHVKGRPAWLIEGFTTYYQDVLRARAGMQSVQSMWDDLHDAIVRLCPPDGTSLEEDSQNLRKTHRYQHVYWGGACVALQLDVAIRARTNNAQSLDTVLKQAWKDSLDAPISTDEMIARFDAAAGAPVTKRALGETHVLDFSHLYTQLGLRRRDAQHVELLSDAPLRHVRDKIMSNAQR